MSCQPFPDQLALFIGDGKVRLISDYSVPQSSDIADLFLRREFVEAGRGDRNDVCHDRRLPPAGGIDNLGTLVSGYVKRSRIVRKYRDRGVTN